MNKNIIFYWGIGTLFFIACTIFPQSSNRRDLGSPAAKPILTGWLSERQILDQSQNYKLEKELYQPNPESLAKLKTITTDIQIIVFLGTWCSDSRREVPRFLKVMEQVQNSHIQYQLLGVDRTKRDAGGLAEKHQIEFVPTFVVLYENNELGRIVETPMVSLEQDLVEILMSVN